MRSQPADKTKPIPTGIVGMGFLRRVVTRLPGMAVDMASTLFGIPRCSSERLLADSRRCALFCSANGSAPTLL